MPGIFLNHNTCFTILQFYHSSELKELVGIKQDGAGKSSKLSFKWSFLQDLGELSLPSSSRSMNSKLGWFQPSDKLSLGFGKVISIEILDWPCSELKLSDFELLCDFLIKFGINLLACLRDPF